MLSKMMIDGMRNGCFPMDTDEGVKACREYRDRLEADGYVTWLEWFAGGLFIVRKEKKEDH